MRRGIQQLRKARRSRGNRPRKAERAGAVAQKQGRHCGVPTPRAGPIFGEERSGPTRARAIYGLTAVGRWPEPCRALFAKFRAVSLFLRRAATRPPRAGPAIIDLDAPRTLSTSSSPPSGGCTWLRLGRWRSPLESLPVRSLALSRALGRYTLCERDGVFALFRSRCQVTLRKIRLLYLFKISI